MRPLTLQTVLVATDLEPSSDAALDSAHRLAKSAGAALHVLHVLSSTVDRSGTGAQRPSGSTDAAYQALGRAGVPGDDAKLHLIPGSPAEVIGSLADRLAADVVVLGPHRQGGRTGQASPLGGTARAVAERAFAPCLVAPQPLRLPLERVLVPIDLSETARGALLVGLSWASALRAGTTNEGTTLIALHVDTTDEDRGAGAPTSVQRELERLRRDAGDWARVTVRGTTTQERSDAAKAITDYAIGQQADLVVLGTRGLGLDEVERLGSVSASVTTRLDAPMLLVPPAVWRAHALVP